MSKYFIEKLTVGSQKSNCYLLADKKSKETAIIDPGDDSEYIKNKIADNKLNPKYIIATHGHFDHIMAAYDLKHSYNIPFIASKKDEFLVKRMQETAKYFLSIESGPSPKIDSYIEENGPLSAGSIILKVIPTPGHTPGSITLFSKKLNIAFVGDLLFKGGGIGRYDFKYSNKENLVNSTKKVLGLKKNIVIYPGHGEETSVENELHYHT